MFIVFTSLCINRVNGAFSGQPAVDQSTISALARETQRRILAISTGLIRIVAGAVDLPASLTG